MRMVRDLIYFFEKNKLQKKSLYAFLKNDLA